MPVPYKLNYFEIETGIDSTSTFIHTGDLTATKLKKYLATSNDILLGDGTTTSLSGLQSAITLTTNFTSGVATLIGNTLNIPNYTGGGGAGFVTLDTTQTITGAKTFTSEILSNRVSATVAGDGAAIIASIALNNAVAGSFTNNTTLVQNSPTLFVQQNGAGRIATFQSSTASIILESDGDLTGVKDLTLSGSFKKNTISTIYNYDLPNANGTIALVGGAGVGTVTSVSFTLGASGTDLSSSVTNSTTTPVITLNVPTASATNRGALSAADWSTFNSKQVSGNYITSLTGEATASGPGAAAVTLTNSAVIAKVLTGLNVTGGTVVAADSILAAFGKVQNQINGLIGGSIFQGVWNASTNTPALVSSVGTNGHYYIVSVAGSTNLNGITDWQIGDWAIFAGTSWQKVDNTDAVSSVNGFTGAVSLTTDNVSEGATNLYFTNTRARTAISLTTTGSSGPSTYNNTTGVFNIPTYTDAFVGTVTSVGLSSTTSGVTIASTPITTSGTITIDIATATASQNGLLSSTDWTTFNNKQGAIILTTNFTSGVATLIGNTLNIPNYADGGITSLATIGASPNAFGATIAGTQLNLEPASASFGGVVTTLAQTFAGDKTLTGALIGTTGSFTSSGGSDTFSISHSSGAGIALNITKGGNGEGIYVNKTSGSGNAVTIIGTLNATTLVKSGGTSAQFLKADGTVDSTAYGTGSVTSVAALTLGTTGTDLSSTVANGTTTPVITLNVPTASATNRGALSSADWSTFNGKQDALSGTGIVKSTAGVISYLTDPLPIANGGTGSATQTFVDLTTTQTIAGFKTFSSTIKLTNGTSNGFSLESGTTGFYASLKAPAGLAADILVTLPSTTGTLALTSAIPANPVGGTGTTNNLPKFTGASTIGDSAITDNGTTVTLVSRALSGTSATFSGGVTSRVNDGSAQFNAEPITTTNSAYIQFLNSDGYGYIGKNSSAGGNLATGSAAYALVVSTYKSGGTTAPIQFAPNNSVAMTITSGGNVGIGTTSPSALLNTFSASTATQILVTGADTTNQRLEVTDGTVTNRFGIFGRTNGDAGVLGTQSNHPLVFNTNATERMRITSVGNVEVRSAGKLIAYRSDNTRYGEFFTDGVAVHLTSSTDPLRISSADRTEFYTGATERVRIASTGVVTISNLAGSGSRTVTADSSGVLSAASDSRLKQEDLGHKIEGLSEILKIQPRAYKWLSDIENKGENATTEIGFFANEVSEIIPSAAPKGNDGYYGFYDRAIIAALVKSVQELKAEIDILKNK